MVFSPRDLKSSGEANRPSIDQMLPTRYSQLELDSHRQSSSNDHARQTQLRDLILTPTGGSSGYLARKKRHLDEHLLAAAASPIGNDIDCNINVIKHCSNNDKQLVLPFEYEEEDKTTVKEEEYGLEASRDNAYSLHQPILAGDAQECNTPIILFDDKFPPIRQLENSSATVERAQPYLHQR